MSRLPASAPTARLAPGRLLALQAFDLAIRLGSFKAAAEALHLSPSAVSHRIRGLERELGARLFERGHRAIAPTARGEALARITGRAFADLARAASPAGQAGGRQVLRLRAFPLFASAWLIPRLAQFRAAHPAVDLAIEASSLPVDFLKDVVDAGICVGTDVRPNPGAVRLADISASPIATPALARSLRLRAPRDLRRAVLIHVKTFPLAWRSWLKSAGAPDLHPAGMLEVDTFVDAVQAAEQGAGVALGMDLFMAEPERRGRLQRLFPLDHPIGSYWFVQSRTSGQAAALRAFKRWLLAEFPAPAQTA